MKVGIGNKDSTNIGKRRLRGKNGRKPEVRLKMNGKQKRKGKRSYMVQQGISANKEQSIT